MYLFCIIFLFKIIKDLTIITVYLCTITLEETHLGFVGIFVQIWLHNHPDGDIFFLWSIWVFFRVTVLQLVLEVYHFFTSSY